MARYTIETLQMHGEWLGDNRTAARSKSAAMDRADDEHGEWGSPKRVVNIETREVIYTVGDTPEHRARMARAMAELAEMDARDAFLAELVAKPAPRICGNARTSYRKARALIRANGMYALRWIDDPAMARALALLDQQSADYLRIRSRIEPRDVKTRMRLWPAVSPR